LPTLQEKFTDMVFLAAKKHQIMILCVRSANPGLHCIESIDGLRADGSGELMRGAASE
jgi:hypothetical protein